MPKEINLLHGRNKARLKIKGQADKIKLISFIVLAFYLLSGSGLFVYLLWAKKENSQIDRLIQTKKQQIVDLKKSESLLLNLKQRLSFLSTEVVLDQNLASRSVDLLNEIEDSRISINNLSLADDDQIILSGQTIDVLALTDFLNKVNKGKGKTKIAVLSNLSRSETGAYNFNLSLSFN